MSGLGVVNLLFLALLVVSVLALLGLYIPLRRRRLSPGARAGMAAAPRAPAVAVAVPSSASPPTREPETARAGSPPPWIAFGAVMAILVVGAWLRERRR